MVMVVILAMITAVTAVMMCLVLQNEATPLPHLNILISNYSFVHLPVLLDPLPTSRKPNSASQIHLMELIPANSTLFSPSANSISAVSQLHFQMTP